MELIRGFCGKLRALAVTLDSETARLQRALHGEDSDFEGYPVRILHDLHSEVRTLKDDVSTLLDKASLESKESVVFIKATKVLMKKNSMDIMKIREFFQKYGYNPRAKKNSVGEQDAVESKPESSGDENLQNPGVQDAATSSPVVSHVPEKSPCSPQLSDFGLERYLISQVPPNPPQVENDPKEEPEVLTPAFQQSLVKVLKTPKCALNMDDFECVTPQLEHVGISEYTLCLNEDYTVGLKNVKNKSHASEEAGATEPVPSGNFFATPGLMNQQLGKNGVKEHSGLVLGWVSASKKTGVYERVAYFHFKCETGPPLHTILRSQFPVDYIVKENMTSDADGYLRNSLRKSSHVIGNAEYTKSPLAPTFCTPGLKIPSTKNSTAVVSTDYPVSKTNSSSSDLEMKDCTSLVLNSDKCFEDFVAPSSPVISSHENLLRTPTPPKVTTIPEDILQILSKYNRNLATPVALKAVPPSEVFLTNGGGQRTRDGVAPEPVGKF